MSTPAIIAAANTKGQITLVNVNWDGDKLLSTLTGYYQSIEAANELVSHGDISSLGIRIEPIGTHSFNYREDGTTTYYHRDRGEPLNVRKFRDYGDFSDYLDDVVYDKHVYFFDGKQWNKI